MAKRQGFQAENSSTFKLEEVIPSFLSDYYASADGTQNYYGGMVGRVLAAWMREHRIGALHEVTPDVMRAYMRDQMLATFKRGNQPPQSLSRGTVIHRYETARRFLKWCMDQGYLDANPMDRVKRPTPDRDVQIGFTREECGRLVKYAGQAPGFLAKRDRALVLLMLGTAGRASEILGLTPADIDGPHHRLRLFGKGRRARWVPLGGKAAEALRDWMRVRPRLPGDPMWVTQRRTPLSVNSLEAMLVNLGKYAGVENVRPHRFRHTAATEYTRAHRDIMATKALLGHSKLETTKGYLGRLGVDYATEVNYATPDTWLG